MIEPLLFGLVITSTLLSVGNYVLAWIIWRRIEHESAIRRMDQQLKYQRQNHETNGHH